MENAQIAADPIFWIGEKAIIPRTFHLLRTTIETRLYFIWKPTLGTSNCMLHLTMIGGITTAPKPKS